MSKQRTTILATLTFLSSVLCPPVYAAPGEYWEVTTKMEMPGMPFAMPATTQKTCIPKGKENDPGATSGDKDCQMTDVKTVGNKTSWKARCDHNGEVMIGSGEQSTSADGYEGKMQLAGKSGGQDMNMNMAFSGKRLGGSCDSEEMVKKMQSQTCDSSHLKTTSDWIASAGMYLSKESPCPGKKEELCSRVRKDAPIDAEVYSALVQSNTHSNTNIAQDCGIDMAATTTAICKTLNSKNIQKLSPYCPTEAKAHREDERRKACEGRSYTASSRAEDFKKCMSGNDMSDSQGDSAPEANMPNEASLPSGAGKPSSDNPAAEVLESAKKLKGMFGL